jgi:hypothetical protein
VEQRRAGQAVGSSRSGDEEMVSEQRRPSLSIGYVVDEAGRLMETTAKATSLRISVCSVLCNHCCIYRLGGGV